MILFSFYLKLIIAELLFKFLEISYSVISFNSIKIN